MAARRFDSVVDINRILQKTSREPWEISRLETWFDPGYWERLGVANPCLKLGYFFKPRAGNEQDTALQNLQLDRDLPDKHPKYATTLRKFIGDCSKMFNYDVVDCYRTYKEYHKRLATDVNPCNPLHLQAYLAVHACEELKDMIDHWKLHSESKKLGFSTR